MFYGDLDRKSNRFVLVLEDMGDMETMDQIEGREPGARENGYQGGGQAARAILEQDELGPVSRFLQVSGAEESDCPPDNLSEESPPRVQ